MSESAPKKLSQLDYIIAGAGAGVITRMIAQPLDVLKIRFQLQVEPISQGKASKYQSVIHGMKLIIKEEGIVSLWKGHVPAQMLSISYGIFQFWFFEKLTENATKLNLPHSFTPAINFVAGAIAGCSATAASFPFDVIRTRLVAQSEQHKIYTGSLHAFRKIVKTEGFLVLYKGLLPTFIQIAPLSGIQFMCYKYFINFYKYLTNSHETTLTGSLISGGLAGLCAKSVVYPFDIAKKRLQIQGFEQGRLSFGTFFTCGGLIDCFIRIYKIEGLLGLFKGLSPSLIKAVCTTGLHFSSYEMICNLLQKD